MDGRNRLNKRLTYTTLSALEKDNRNQKKLRKWLCPKGAGVAEHGQTRTNQEGLNARDSRSRPRGVRGFKSHPLHHRI